MKQELSGLIEAHGPFILFCMIKFCPEHLLYTFSHI